MQLNALLLSESVFVVKNVREDYDKLPLEISKRITIDNPIKETKLNL